MNSRFVPHLIWTLIAGAAFSLGHVAGSRSDGSLAAPASSGASSSTVSANTGSKEAKTLRLAETEMPAPLRRDKAVEHFSGQEGNTRPLSAEEKPQGTMIDRAAEAMLMGSDLRRQRTFLALLEEMRPEDAIAIRSLLAKATDQGVVYENLWEQFWTRWGEIDGPGAMEYILETQKHGSVPKDIARVMRGWGAANPDEAARWLDEHQGQGDLGAGLIGLTDGYASESLSGATALALAAAPSGDPLLGKLMETLSEQAIRQGRVHGLTSWFDQLPSSSEPGSARAAALGHVYWRLWQADQDRALDWVQQQSSTPWRSDRIVGEIAQRVAQQDPAKAFQWLQGVPPSPKDGSYPGLVQVVGAWLARDPAVAAQTLQSLAPGTFKDQVLAAQQGVVSGKPSPR